MKPDLLHFLQQLRHDLLREEENSFKAIPGGLSDLEKSDQIEGPSNAT